MHFFSLKSPCYTRNYYWYWWSSSSMATSTPMSFPLSLLFLSLILLFAPATKADIALHSTDLSDGNSILTSQNRRTKINGGTTLTDGPMAMVVTKDCSVYLHYKRVFRPVYVLRSGLATKDCYLYLSDRGVLYVHTNDIRIADQAIFGEESEQGRYALVLHRATLAIYGPALWSNGVGSKQASLGSSSPVEVELPSSLPPWVGNIFYSGDTFEGRQNGDVAVAKEGDVTAYLRPNCTLAVQLKNGTVLWSTGSDHTVLGQCKLEIKSNGQLVIRDYYALPIGEKKVNLYYEVFNSQYKSKDDNSYICLLWFEGEMVIYPRKVWMYKGQWRGIKMVTQ